MSSRIAWLSGISAAPLAPCSAREMTMVERSLAEPQSVEELVDQSVGRALDLFGLSWGAVRRWGRDIGPITAEEAEG